MKMYGRLCMLLLILKASLGKGIEIYVNKTHNISLSAGFGCEKEMTDLCTIQVKLNGWRIITESFLNGARVGLFSNQTRQNMSIHLQTTSNYTLFLLDIDIIDAGLYVFEKLNMRTSISLFVLDQPSIPQITVLDNGIVGFTRGSIFCNSTSNSKPSGLKISFMWLVNGSMIEVHDIKYSFVNRNTSVLLVDVERGEKANKYSCMAKEIYGQSSYSDVNVQLIPRSPPLVDINSSKTLVKILEYDSFTLKCKTSGAVPRVVSYNWYKNDELKKSYDSEQYALYNITRQDAAQYTCTASNGLPIIGNGSIVIEVLYGPEINDMSSISQEDGHNVSILCKFTSYPSAPHNEEHVTWTKDNTTQFAIKGKTLSIPHLNKKDNGTFKCNVALTFYPTYGDPVVKTDSKTVNVNVLYGPIVSSSINELNPKEHDEVNIECHSDSNPETKDNNVTWYFTSNVGSHPTKLNNFGNNLKKSAIQRNESGMYICLATIALKPTYGPQIVRNGSSSVAINVLYQPSIIRFDSKTVNESAMVNLTCKVIGNPMAKVHWMHEPTNLTLSEYITINHSSIEVSSILRFPEARCNDTGSYVCVANNNIKKAVYKSSSLFVNCVPRLHYQEFPDGNITVKRNETLNFTDWFYAYPPPSFHLSKSNSTEPIERHGFTLRNITDQQFSYRIGSRIFKQEFEHSDIGNYVLVATNNIGHVNVSYNIIYTRKPDRPFNVTVNCWDIYSTAVVKWNAGWNGGSSQNFYIVYRHTKNENILFGTNSPIEEKSDDLYSHLLYGLLPNENYIFIVNASNDIGYQESEEINCTTTGIPETSNSDSIFIRLGPYGILVIVVIFSIPVAVIFYQRKRAHKKGNNMELLESRNGADSFHEDTEEDKDMELLESRSTADSFHEDSEEGLKDNICYISAGDVTRSAEYAIDQKTVGNKKDKNMKLLESRNGADSFHEDSEEGLKDNICYISAGEVTIRSAEYAIVQKTVGNKKDKNMKLLESRSAADSCHEDSEEGLKDNICYISAGEVTITSAEYAIVQKTVGIKKDKDKKVLGSRNGIDTLHEDGEDGLKDNICYISADDIDKKATPAAEYAIVQKPVGKKKDGSVGLKNPFSKNKKETRQNDAYEVVERRLSYGDSKKQTKKQKKGNELPYADLDFSNTPNKSKFVIRGQQDKTNYSDIDFTKKAEPIPDEVQNEETYMNL